MSCNPYAEGTNEHVAWEEGYLAAIEDDVVVMDSFFAASVDTHPKDGDSTKIEAPLVSGAVPSEASADAQTQPHSQEHRQPPVSE